MKIKKEKYQVPRSLKTERLIASEERKTKYPRETNCHKDKIHRKAKYLGVPNTQEERA